MKYIDKVQFFGMATFHSLTLSLPLTGNRGLLCFMFIVSILLSSAAYQGIENGIKSSE